MLVVVAATLCTFVRCDYYQVTVSDVGWTTGLRQNINASLNMSGSAVGEGTFQRYTEMKFNDVRMRERIAADNGTLDTSERVRVDAEVRYPIEYTLVKYPGGQNYTLAVQENWPVAINASRSIDYLGKSISDRDFLGNNLDYVGASYFQAKDLRMDRSAFLELKNATFELGANDSTKKIYENKFLPAKSIDYRLNSLSKGTATLRYRQVEDHSVANEGFESYTGDFLISRHIAMYSSGTNSSTQNETDWLDGCPFQVPSEELYGIGTQAFEVNTYS